MRALCTTMRNTWKVAVVFLFCWPGSWACTPAFEGCGDTRTCAPDQSKPDAAASGGSGGSESAGGRSTTTGGNAGTGATGSGGAGAISGQGGTVVGSGGNGAAGVVGSGGGDAGASDAGVSDASQDGSDLDGATEGGPDGGCHPACSTSGTVSTTCSNGVCTPKCDATHLDCNGKGADGCEVDIKNDPLHCGTCDVACGKAGTTAQACNAGVCKATCDATHLDCDTDGKNGCEVDGQSDAANCGACKYACSKANATDTSCVKGACAPVCITNYGNCGAAPKASDDGCEADLTKPQGCGACGHDCLGGTCSVRKDSGNRVVGAMCDALPLAQSLATPWAIAFDATNLYYTMGGVSGSVMKQALSGGFATAISSNEGFPEDIALDDTYVYWCDELNGSAAIRRELKTDLDKAVNIVNGSSTVLYPCPIAVQGEFVYFTDYGSRRIFRALKNGDEIDLPKPMTPVVGVASYTLELDANNYYWAPGGPEYGPIATVSTMEFPVTGAAGTALTTDTSYLYFQTRNGTVVSLARSAKASLTAAPQTIYSLAGLGQLRDHMTTDATYLYFATDTGLYKVLKTGGAAPILLSTAVNAVSDMAINGTALYWTNAGADNGSTGSVMRLAL